MKFRGLMWAPLAFFAALFVVMAGNLSGRSVVANTSHLVGKPLPRFSLPAATSTLPGLGSANYTEGRPRLLNIFASWCGPCAVEAPQLMRLSRMGIPVDAIAVRDRQQDLDRFLRQFGNPYQRIGSDTDSHVQLSLGSSGVPETFVIDGRGIIRYHHVGDIRADDIPGIVAEMKLAAR